MTNQFDVEMKYWGDNRLKEGDRIVKFLLTSDEAMPFVSAQMGQRFYARIIDADAADRNGTYLEAALPVPDTASELARAGESLCVGQEAGEYKSPVAQPPRPSRSWNEIPPAEQAAIRCSDGDFCKYLRATSELEAAERVREMMGVKSRSELSNNPEKAAKWRAFDAGFRKWRDALPS